MLRVIIFVSLLAGALSDRDCLNIKDFDTKVQLEDIPEGDWYFIADKGRRYHCMAVTLTPVTEGDIERVKASCKGVELENGTAIFDYNKAIKKMTYSKHVSDTLMSKQDGELYFLGTCSEAVHMEFRRYKDNYVWYVWNLNTFGPHSLAIRVSPDENRRCFEEDNKVVDFCTTKYA